MLDQAIRYGSILAQPEFEGSDTILEVGSGTGGISSFTGDQVVGVDIRFEGRKSENLSAVRASVTALPFRNASFNRVICSDVMEHLPDEARPKALEELVRITGETLFLACPCGQPARRLDSFLFKLYESLKISPPEWMIEHIRMGIPDAESIRSVLRHCSVSFRELPGESWITHFVVTLLISSRLLNNFWRRVFLKNTGRVRKIGRISILTGRSPYRRLWVVSSTEYIYGPSSARKTK